MSRRAIALAALAAALIAPAAVGAQETAAAPQRPLTFGIAAGVTFPTGDAGDLYDWGFHLAGAVSGRPGMSPVGLRGELMWHRLTGGSVDAGEFGSVDVPDVNVIAGIGNAEIGLGGSSWRPYLIGGLGIYRLSAEDVDAETKFGFNVGVGFQRVLAGFDAFGELRLHSIQTEGESTNLIPISIGFRF
jgi:hypothetical protein